MPNYFVLQLYIVQWSERTVAEIIKERKSNLLCSLLKYIRYYVHEEWDGRIADHVMDMEFAIAQLYNIGV